MAVGPLCRISARTARKISLPLALRLLRECLLRPLGDGYRVIDYQMAYLRSRSLATSISAGFTILAFSIHATIFYIVH